MFEYLISGIVYGAVAGVSPGPLLTLVIRETLAHNRRAGFSVAIAPLVTDVPIVSLSLFGLSRLNESSVIFPMLSFLGAAFIIYLGVESILHKQTTAAADHAPLRSFGRAVFTNLLSPHPYLFWLLVGAPTALRAAKSGIGAPIAFIVGFYLLLIGTKFTVAYLTDQSKRVLSTRIYGYVIRFLGIALLVFAGLLIRDGIRYVIG